MARRPIRLVAALATTTLVVALVPALAAQAAPAASVRVVATGLDNPRQLTIGAGGSVYVAEAGRGGSGPCIPNPEGGDACLGATGAVTKITRRGQERVITGLPSLAGPDGGGAAGPADVAVNGSWVSVLVGLGGAPEARDSLGDAGARLGTVLHGRLGGPLAVAADPVAHEAAHNPAGEDLDSNPTGLVARGNSGQFIVADAGANAIESLGRKGDTTVAVIEGGEALAPPFLGLPPGTMIPVQAVPTDVVVGPDGALYVSELTGFPFPPGGSVIWRVVPGQAPSVYATGLTNVTSLDWRGNTLYAVQLSDTGLLGGMEGSLRRVVPGGSAHPVVAGGLFAPYGVAIHGNTAYVSTCSVCAFGGEVRAVPLR